MSQLKTDKITARTASGTITLGASGETFAVASGVSTTGFGGLASVQYFTSSGTWTKPTGVTKVMVEVLGAGGGGSRHDSNAALVNAGGAGGYAKKLLDVSSVTSSTITIGTGGTGAATQGVGSAGGASSWADGVNTNVVGNGGEGGTNASYPTLGTSGAGGTATGGDFNFTGMNGSIWSGNSGAVGTPQGGSTFYGFGGWQHYGYRAASNSDGIGYGSGGSGGYTPSAAGNGADGLVIVTEYK